MVDPVLVMATQSDCDAPAAGMGYIGRVDTAGGLRISIGGSQPAGGVRISGNWGRRPVERRETRTSLTG